MIQRNAARIKKISHAIEVYLEQRTKHEARMAEHSREFEMGKRHLANIMGRDPNSHMSQVGTPLRAACYLHALMGYADLRRTLTVHSNTYSRPDSSTSERGR